MNVKHFIRDAIVCLVSITGVAFVYRCVLRRRGPLVRIIAFHDVADPVWFEEVIKMLNKKYHLITPEQFHAKEFSEQKINILLTFDDGYQTWIDNCLPVLRRHSLKGLFFINSGLLDVASDQVAVALYYKERMLISPKVPLTWEGARLLVAEGHTIGGHTVTHPNLALLDSKEAREEIENDKKRHEEMLGVTLQDFAYPFGREHNYTEAVFDVVHKAGYTWQYSAVSRFVTSKDIAIFQRTLVENLQKSEILRRWIEGGYDIFEFLK